jgi:hypothetical protein
MPLTPRAAPSLLPTAAPSSIPTPRAAPSPLPTAAPSSIPTPRAAPSPLPTPRAAPSPLPAAGSLVLSAFIAEAQAAAPSAAFPRIHFRIVHEQRRRGVRHLFDKALIFSGQGASRRGCEGGLSAVRDARSGICISSPSFSVSKKSRMSTNFEKNNKKTYKKRAQGAREVYATAASGERHSEVAGVRAAAEAAKLRALSAFQTGAAVSDSEKGAPSRPHRPAETFAVFMRPTKCSHVHMHGRRGRYLRKVGRAV